MKLVHPVALILALQLLTASGDVAALVLCFGADGHVSVEVADATQRCNDSPIAHHAPMESTEWTRVDDCGPCNDVALFARSATLSGTPDKTKAATTPARHDAPESSDPQATRLEAGSPLPADTPVAIALRTIVLLV